MIDDLIRRQDAIENCKAEFLNPNVQRDTEAQTLADQSFAKGWNACNRQWISELSQLPSAQLGIIRCKDCKYRTYIKRTNRHWCKTDDGLYDLNPSPNDFCSRAERKDVTLCITGHRKFVLEFDFDDVEQE